MTQTLVLPELLEHLEFQPSCDAADFPCDAEATWQGSGTCPCGHPVFRDKRGTPGPILMCDQHQQVMRRYSDPLISTCCMTPVHILVTWVRL